MDPFFTQREHGQITIIQFVTESLMNQGEVERIGQTLHRLVSDEKRHHMLLDFTRVRYLSSQAIGLLISLNRTISQAKGKLALCGVGPQLMELLKITKLERLFRTYPNQQDAIAQMK